MSRLSTEPIEQTVVDSPRRALNPFELIGPALGWVCVVSVVLSLLVDFFIGESDLRSGLWSWTAMICVLGFTYVVIAKNLLVYVVRRLGEASFVILVIATITFILLRFLPGGPFDSEKALPPEVKANIEAKYHLNDPLITQYSNYIYDLLHGNLGESYKYIGRSVTDILVQALPVSIQLGVYALVLSFLIGIPLGVFAAAKHNTWKDSTLMIAAMSGVALPSFLVGPIFILIFANKLEWLPPAMWEGPIYYILPVVTLGIRPAAIIARLTRSSVLDVIHSDFIRTARAKGLDQRIVLFKHVLRNSLIPVLTVSGPLIANLLSGSFIIEIIFAVPGMGRHFVQSVTNRDYPLIMGATLVYASILVLANMLVDLLYAVVDPRIRLS